MKKINIMVVVGTRPEIIRLSSIIKKLHDSKAFNLSLVHTGQNYDYELNQAFFEDLELPKPNHYLDANKQSALKAIASILSSMDEILTDFKPDCVLILGDTNSSLSAIAAKKYQIPIFHMEAGNRCFDQRVPEETNRKLVDHIADVNLPYSDIAREYLIKENYPADRIIKTGSPMFEVIHSNLNKIRESNVLEKLGFKSNQYYLVSTHRQENVDNPEKLKELVSALNELAIIKKYPILISVHPRTKVQLEKLDIELNSLIIPHKPFNFSDYCKLQLNANIVISDSGTISEEASILGFKAINIRDSHERPEAMEVGTVMMTGYDKNRIFQAIELLSELAPPESVRDYNFPKVSDTVQKVVLSYINYVQKNVWKK